MVGRCRRSCRLTRVHVVVALVVAAACALPAQAAAKPAYGGTAPEAGPAPSGPASGAPLTTTPGERARLLADGTAQAPASAPEAVKRVIAAGNQIARLPYRYGGGHAVLNDTAYDCSGSVSFALHGADLLDYPYNSTMLETWGEAGPGTWVTVYANAGHTFMVVAGLRYDTSGQRQAGTRWQPLSTRSYDGFVMRHPAGL